MIPKEPGPDLIRAGNWFSEKACPHESGGHAPPITQSGMMIRRKIIPLQSAFLTLHASCVALSARQIRGRAAKSVLDIRLSRPAPEMPAETQPAGPVEEADRVRRRACPMSHIALRAAPARSAS